jgi:hypothetical protein
MAARKKTAKPAPKKKTPARKAPAKKAPEKRRAPSKKAAGRTRPQSSTPSSANAAPAAATSRISVRMYRQGLGDCFLIAFPTTSARPFFMLIDCGVVLGTPDATSRMQKVVNDIARVTGVSGFVQSRDLFDKMTFRQVWVAWTEDPADTLAKKLRAERRIAENALRMAVAHLGLAGDSGWAQRVGSLVEFFRATSGSTEDALAYVKKRSAEGKPRYCRPGEPPISLPELPGILFWVLGPPRDEKLIKKSNPGKNTAYGLDAGPEEAQALLIAGLTRGMGAAADALIPADSIKDPFDSVYSIPLARASHVPFFERRYYGDSSDGSVYDNDAKQEVRDQSWRRIDTAWMGVSETMGLQLDSAANNTSLVLAIEMVATGELLLFPGDAQAGNWLSWQDLKWEPGGSVGPKSVTGTDLLARTVFYKVGHHGSHNSTLKAKGLELMVSDALVAVIPVDHAMAVKKRWGRMPLPDLVERLKEKTHGRVLKVDDEVKTTADLAKLKPASVSPADWKLFTDRVRVTEHYYEISF